MDTAVPNPDRAREGASTRPGSQRGGAARAAPRRRPDDVPWVAHGIAAGILGAFCVAVFFGVIDVLSGQPLWTPTALGTALFLGRPLAPGASPDLLMVLAYTAMHGTVFVAFGLMASLAVLSAHRSGSLPRSGLGPIAGVALFLAFEAAFLSFAAMYGDSLLAVLGGGRVAVANLLAAGSMGLFLAVRSRAVATAA